jgi:hypothetical protein
LHLPLPPFPAPCVIFFRNWISPSHGAMSKYSSR